MPPDKMVGQFWDAVIWMGDFNSRIENFKYKKSTVSLSNNHKAILAAIKDSNYEGVTSHD